MVGSNGPEVTLYTDGACQVTTGRGGWAFILDYKGNELEGSGGLEGTTNNRMELMAVIRGLQALKKPCTVEVITDSMYIVNSYTKGWVFNWMHKTNFGGKKNEDLWKLLVSLGEIHSLSFRHVKGHSGHPQNERCDKMAVKAYSTNNNLETDKY